MTPPFVLMVALLLETFIPFPARWKPSALVPVLARLVQRVHHQYASHQQQVITGLLLPIVVLIPSLIASWSFRNLAPISVMYDVLLLFWLLESQSIREGLIVLRQLLTQKKQSLAKLHLRQFVLRETQTLSEMGLCKAAIEMSILRITSQWMTVGLIYLLLGIHGALFFRLVQLIAQSCNIKLNSNRLCGEISARITQSMNVLSLLVVMLFQSLLPRGIAALKICFKQFRLWPDLVSGLLLIHTGIALQLGLGGPRIYQTQKIRYPRIGAIKDPEPAQLLSGYRRIALIGWTLWIILFSIDLWFHYAH